MARAQFSHVSTGGPRLRLLNAGSVLLRQARLQAAGEIPPRARSAREAVDMEWPHGDLSERAYKQLGPAQRRDYAAVAAPDLERAVRHCLEAAQPLQLPSALAAWVWALEDGAGDADEITTRGEMQCGSKARALGVGAC